MRGRVYWPNLLAGVTSLIVYGNPSADVCFKNHDKAKSSREVRLLEQPCREIIIQEACACLENNEHQAWHGWGATERVPFGLSILKGKDLNSGPNLSSFERNDFRT